MYGYSLGSGLIKWYHTDVDGVDWWPEGRKSFRLHSVTEMTVIAITSCFGLAIFNYKPYYWAPSSNLILAHTVPTLGDFQAKYIDLKTLKRRDVTGGTRKILDIELIQNKSQVGSCRWTGPHVHVVAAVDQQIVKSTDFKIDDRKNSIIVPNYTGPVWII